MRKFFLTTTVLAIGAFVTFSCSESRTKTDSQETIEIEKMDSTGKEIKENTLKLEDQTKKVEQALEKLDKEFATDK